MNFKFGVHVQERRFYRIIGVDIKEDWGSGDPSGVKGRSPGRGFGGRSPLEAEAVFMKLHMIFALKYNKQQLLSLESTS